MGLTEGLDVVGAVNYLAGIGYKEVVVYGHSVGGAAVLHGLGKDKNMIDSRIQIKGAIVEKTFANAANFYKRLHETWFSDPPVNALYASLSTRIPEPRIIKTSEFQYNVLKSAVETIGGYKIPDNIPSDSAKKISSPLLVISNKGGDSIMDEKDSRLLAQSAPNASLLVVDSDYETLEKKHQPEFLNPQVLIPMAKFIIKSFQ